MRATRTGTREIPAGSPPARISKRVLTGPALTAMAAAALFWPARSALAYPAEAARCIAATAQAERALHVPDGFLNAMSRVESGRPGPDGTISAWPWTITAAGIGHYYPTRAEATAAVEIFRQQGIQSIDVGCMQVNLQQHPDAFASLDQAFDPMANALYAGRFLLQMYDKTGSWPRAAAAYHSQTPGIGTPYQWKVLEAWAIPQDGRDTRPAPAPPAFPHPAMPRAIRQPTRTADAQPEADGNPPPPARTFHPFQGFAHFSQPTLHRPAAGNMRGRTLASYRANPVALAGPTG
ncbi:transglycosylase SLT domain-containing protein [Gluconacetobacter sacchari]|nr:transglycosylase SLT domain-containing protein [Gluconacetobacter sacchari]